jgi:hypothetical protein
MRIEPTFRPAPHVVAKTVGDELVLLDYEGGVYYGLDAVGSRVWELLTAGATVTDAVDALTREYDVAREDLQRDVERLVAELEESGLLTAS